MISFIVKNGWRSFMMSFRMSLKVKLAPKNTLLLIMLIYIDIGGNEHLNKFKSNLGRGSPTIWAMPERKGVFFRQCLPFNGWTCSPQKVGEPWIQNGLLLFFFYFPFFLFSDMQCAVSGQTINKQCLTLVPSWRSMQLEILSNRQELLSKMNRPIL